MTALMRGGDVIGLAVVDVSTGEDVAEVRDIIFEPSEGIIGGFTLGRRGFFGRRLREVLPAEMIRSVGTHAVTIDSAAAITDPNEAPAEVAAVDRKADVTANEVMTESGRKLGRVRDVIVARWTEPEGRRLRDRRRSGWRRLRPHRHVTRRVAQHAHRARLASRTGSAPT